MNECSGTSCLFQTVRYDLIDLGWHNLFSRNNLLHDIFVQASVPKGIGTWNLDMRVACSNPPTTNPPQRSHFAALCWSRPHSWKWYVPQHHQRRETKARKRKEAQHWETVEALLFYPCPNSWTVHARGARIGTRIEEEQLAHYVRHHRWLLTKTKRRDSAPLVS